MYKKASLCLVKKEERVFMDKYLRNMRYLYTFSITVPTTRLTVFSAAIKAQKTGMTDIISEYGLPRLAPFLWSAISTTGTITPLLCSRSKNPKSGKYSFPV